MNCSERSKATLFLLAPLAVFAAGAGYSVVSVDASGQLYITRDDGKQVAPQKTNGQVKFGSPAISSDHQTVGWLVEYSDSFSRESGGDALAGGLVLFRNDRVLHRFATDQTIWDWQFQDGGKRVAYSTGPTHGGATECVLREVLSGRVVALWAVTRDSKPPTWATTLRQ